MKHIVYLLEFDTTDVQRKYIGSKSNAYIVDGKIYSDGKEYRTSSRDPKLKQLFMSDCNYKFSELYSDDVYKNVVDKEKEYHITLDVVASPEFFNKAIATTNNFTDPDYATYKHSVTGKVVRLNRNHPLVLDGTYVGVTKGKPMPESVKQTIRKSGKDNPFYGRKHTDESKALMSERASIGVRKYYDAFTEEDWVAFCKLRSESAKGVRKPQEWVDSIRGSFNMKNPETGECKRVYKEDVDSYRANGWICALVGVKLATIDCPHCGKTGSASNMRRWHFDNCKHKDEHESS